MRGITSVAISLLVVGPVLLVAAPSARAVPYVDPLVFNNEVAIRFNLTLTDAQVSEMFTSRGMSQVKISRIDSLGLATGHLPDFAEFGAISTDLKDEPGVVLVSENSLATFDHYEANDPFYNAANQWWIQSVNLERAHGITTGSSSTFVAILDSGMRYTHEDLSHTASPGSGWDFVDDDGDPADEGTIDAGFHGTKVSGVVGAAIDNGKGLAGAAPWALLIPVRVGGPLGVALDDVCSGISWGTNIGARVITISISSPRTKLDGTPQDLCNPNIVAAKNAGRIVVASSGNTADNTPPQTAVRYPAMHPDVVAVGSIGPTNARSGFSNFGPELDFVAPGEAIQTTDGGADANYAAPSGTSFSTPLVAGIFALVWSFFPQLTRQEMLDKMRTNAADLNTPGFDQQTGWGKPNAWKMFNIGFHLAPFANAFPQQASSSFLSNACPLPSVPQSCGPGVRLNGKNSHDPDGPFHVGGNRATELNCRWNYGDQADPNQRTQNNCADHFHRYPAQDRTFNGDMIAKEASFDQFQSSPDSFSVRVTPLPENACEFFPELCEPQSSNFPPVSGPEILGYETESGAQVLHLKEAPTPTTNTVTRIDLDASGTQPFSRFVSYARIDTVNAPKNFTLMEVNFQGNNSTAIARIALDDADFFVDGAIGNSVSADLVELGTGWHKLEIVAELPRVSLYINNHLIASANVSATHPISVGYGGRDVSSRGEVWYKDHAVTVNNFVAGDYFSDGFVGPSLTGWTTTGDVSLVDPASSALASRLTKTMRARALTGSASAVTNIPTTSQHYRVEADVLVADPGISESQFSLLEIQRSGSTLARVGLLDDGFSLDVQNGTAVKHGIVNLSTDIYHRIGLEVFGSRYALWLDGQIAGVFPTAQVGFPDAIKIGGTAGVAYIDNVRTTTTTSFIAENMAGGALQSPRWKELSTSESTIQLAVDGITIDSPYVSAAPGVAYVNWSAPALPEDYVVDFWFKKPSQTGQVNVYNNFNILRFETVGPIIAIALRDDNPKIDVQINGAWSETSPSLANNQWHHVQSYIRQNVIETGQDDFELWLDGTRIFAGSPTNLQVEKLTMGEDVNATDYLNNNVGSGKGIWDDIVLESINHPAKGTVSTPPNGANMGSDHLITLQGTASDADALDAPSVRLKVNSDVWNAIPGTSSWSSLWNTTALADGAYTLLFEFSDGRDSTTISRSVTINNHSPTPVITKPPVGAQIGSQRMITIQGTASDVDYLDEVTLVEVSINGGAWQTASGTTSWSWTWNATGLPDGSYTIAVRAWDHEESGSASRTVSIDNIPPSPSITKPSVSWSIGGAVTFSGTASDTNHADVIASVETRVDTGTWTTASGTGSWNKLVDTWSAGNGVHNFTAKAWDLEENGTQTKTFNFLNMAGDVPLSNGQTRYSSLNGTGQKEYHRFAVNNCATRLTVTLAGPATSNFDVYLMVGQRPTETVNLASATGAGSGHTLTLNNPLPGDYYVMVKSASGSGQFTLVPSVSYNVNCI